VVALMTAASWPGASPGSFPEWACIVSAQLVCHSYLAVSLLFCCEVWKAAPVGPPFFAQIVPPRLTFGPRAGIQSSPCTFVPALEPSLETRDGSENQENAAVPCKRRCGPCRPSRLSQ